MFPAENLVGQQMPNLRPKEVLKAFQAASEELAEVPKASGDATVDPEG